MSISDVGYAERLIQEALANIGVKQEIKVIMVQNRWRWTIEFESKDFYRHLLKLEKLLQERTGRPIDIRLESQEDKMRRKQRNVLSESKQPSS